MLQLARDLNPDCSFIQADMRSFKLERSFDAILIDDAASYMTTEDDLRSLFACACRHLSAGGVMVTGPDDTKETFRHNQTSVWQSEERLAPPGTSVTYVVNSFDPDPNDSSYESAMVYLIREDGRLRVEHDLHVLGLFPIDTWRNGLTEVGFQLHEEQYSEGSNCHTVFVCVKAE
jgi:hypothetical protein